MDLRCVVDPPHGWEGSRGQLNGGANDGFVREHERRVVANGMPPEVADQVMGYHNRAQIPFLRALRRVVLCGAGF